MTVALPSEKRQPTLSAHAAKVLLYGPPKIGKTTLAGSIDPDHTLFLATEPGYGALTAYVLPIDSWSDFREAGGLLASGDHDFTTVAVDTIDGLYKLCQDAVLEDLGVRFASDLEYGKGWGAIADEFRLRIAKLASLGLGTWFISHAKSEDVKQRIGSITVHSPSLSGQAAKFLTGFCDFILFATSEQTESGEARLLRTAATENYQAGGRVPLPDPLPLEAGAVRWAMEEACKSLTQTEEVAA